MQFGVTRRDAASRIAKPLYAGESRVRIPPSPQAQSLNVARSSLRRICLQFFEAHWSESRGAPRSFFTACLSYLRIDYRRASVWFLDWVCLLNKPACWGRHLKRPRSERTGGRIRAFLDTSVSASLLYHIEFADKINNIAPTAKFACSLRNTLRKSVRATCGNGAF